MNFTKVCLAAVTIISSILHLSESTFAQEFERNSSTEPKPIIYWIDDDQTPLIPPRILDAINGIRAINGFSQLSYSPELNFAAFIHAADLSTQRRTWHFGSDGSSPITRSKHAGYKGTILGENIAQAFETPIGIIGVWLEDNRSRSNLLEPNAKQLGLGWFQDPDGRTWWVLLIGN